ncbi:MAG TPA: GNAT family N-acetyltransferase [Candidatus Cybelea sp.]
MRLKEIAPEDYVREVLPLTFPLWAGRRSFDAYAKQTLEIAGSAYGRRYYRTVGLYDGKTLLASFKRYERELHDGARQLRAIGFGAVFTPEEFRGRGYASVMIAAELDRARAAGCHLAYLFSDIRPEFYTTFGFRALPSRDWTLRADALPARRIHPAQLRGEDWSGVRRVFAASEALRSAGFSRSQASWSWIQMRIRHASEHNAGNLFNLVLRRRGVRAYVLGARVPERDAYVLDEYGFADEASAELIPSLLRAAAGDLRRITGWVPPDELRHLLPRGTTRKRTRSVFMIAPLHAEGRLLLDRTLAHRNGAFCWATDHI